MAIYKRIPKNWWQKVWFSFKKPETIIADLTPNNWRHRVTIGLTDITVIENSVEYYMTSDRHRNIYIYDKDWFEANYEPVLTFEERLHKLDSNMNATKNFIDDFCKESDPTVFVAVDTTPVDQDCVFINYGDKVLLINHPEPSKNGVYYFGDKDEN